MKTGGGNMMRILFVLIVAVMAVPEIAMAFDHSYKLWNRDLKQFNEGGYVHYGAWQSNHERLDQYLKGMQSVTHRQISRWTPAQKEAFWINAHNALVVIRILDTYPKVFGLNDKHWKIAGQTLTIEDIRDKILRGTESHILLLSNALGVDTGIGAGHDIRILFTMCEGTKSSPPLAVTAYTARHLSREIDRQVKRTLSKSSFLRVDTRLKIFHVGNFFRKYQRDFKKYQGDTSLFEHSTGSNRGVLRFIFPYLDQKTQDPILAKQKSSWRVDYHTAQHVLYGD